MKVEYLQNIDYDINQVHSIFEKELNIIPFYNSLAKSNEKEHYTIISIKKKIENDPKSIIVARNDENKIVGFCFNRFDDYTIWLEWIIVDDYYKVKGVGSQILNKLFESTIDRNCHKVWCDCRTDNFISKSFLKKNGFSILCEIKDHWYRQDFVLLEKKLI